MNRSTAWLMPLATLALSTAAHAAEPGFYFAATGSRVEHEVEGFPGIPVATITPGPITPPGNPFPGLPCCGSVLPGPVNRIEPLDIDVEDVDAGFSATVGYRVNRYLAAEVSYADFGEFEAIERYSFGVTRYELGVRGLSLSVLGSLPLSEQWELFLRAGVLFADQQVSSDVITSSPGPGPIERDYSDEVIIAGAGVQWSFASRWAARLEYQRTGDLKYDDTGESSIEQASLSVLFKL